jgi:polyphosphate kinase
MQRNLDHRVEVLVPVENSRVRSEIHGVLDSALADNVNSWILTPGGEWERAATAKPEKRHAHHDTMMQRALKRARRGARDRRAG